MVRWFFKAYIAKDDQMEKWKMENGKLIGLKIDEVLK